MPDNVPDSPPTLRPPVGPGDHVQGPPVGIGVGAGTGVVELVEYADFQCPHCVKAAAVVTRLRAERGDRLRFAFRHFPLARLHPLARAAAEAGEAAAAQGAFWPMHDLLFARAPALDVPHLLAYAAELGLDADRFDRELSGGVHAARVLGELGLGPATVVGQSMGANTAMLLAADHPRLVTALVLIEGSPAGPDEPELGVQAAEQIGASLRRWPVPFADRAAARAFFAEKGFDAEAWTDGLDARPDGLWPRFEVDTLVACMADLQSRDYWEPWRRVQCPTLLVFGEHGMFDAAHEQQIADELPGCRLVRVPGAGHDVHLDAPGSWVAALRELTRAG